MTEIGVACSVEGFGEVKAVPRLVRRVFEATELATQGVALKVHRPIREQRSKIAKLDHDFRRHVELAARKVGSAGGILIMLDADDDCPGELGPRVAEVAREVRSDRPIVVVVANREYEAWFLSALVSLRGVRGIRADAVPPADPEAIRGAKERLKASMEPGATYAEATEQEALTAQLNLEEACAAPSFARCRDRLTRLFEELAQIASNADLELDEILSGDSE